MGGSIGPLFRGIVAASFVALAPAASAAPCAGFADVDAASPFCGSVTWLRNEGITVGCGDGSLYCPNDPVSRLAMAGFLKRMADATGDAATAQPYNFTLGVSCPYLNVCRASFPTVPAGKLLRLTSIRATFFDTNVNAILFVFRASNLSDPLAAFPVAPFGGAYFGTILNAQQSVDLLFDTGTTPVLELGISAGAGAIHVQSRNKLGVSGYMVDVAP